MNSGRNTDPQHSDKIDTYEAVDALRAVESFFSKLLHQGEMLKFCRVNDALFQALIEFNNKPQRKGKFNEIQGAGKIEVLSRYKKADKYKGKPDDEVRLLETRKFLSECGGQWVSAHSIKGKTIIISHKDPSRILAFWYIVDTPEGIKERIYVRYSTLTEKPARAEEMIRQVKKFGL